MTNRKLEYYVSVAERIYDASAEILCIETTPPIMLDDKMGYIRATIHMRNDRVASATATFILGLQGQGARATNPIEDCETSAVGRALAFLGYTADKRIGYSVASREEVEEAIRREIAIDQLQNTVRQSQARKPDRSSMINRLMQLQERASDLALNVEHPLFAKNITDLTDEEIIELGKYISEEIKANG